MKSFFQRLMLGRYGMDHLNRILLWAYLIIAAADFFLRWRVLYPLSLLLFFAAMFRCFSRNTWKRHQENEWYLSKTRAFRSDFHFRVRKIKEWRTHRYRKCPYCDAVLRLPRRRGTNEVTCPRCRRDFSVTIRL